LNVKARINCAQNLKFAGVVSWESKKLSPEEHRN